MQLIGVIRCVGLVTYTLMILQRWTIYIHPNDPTALDHLHTP